MYLRTLFTAETTNPKSKALRIPETENPGTKEAVNIIIKALIKRLKSPKVKTVIGRVKT